MPTTHRGPAATSKSPAAAGRTATQARDRIIKMLKDDHARVRQAFKQFAKLDAEEDAQVREALVDRTCAELTIHATLEEEVFYPAAREAVRDEDLVEEAEVEHATAKSLIEQLKQMDPDDPKYGPTFTVLGQYIEHHVKEEERELFPQVAKAKLDWESLCDDMNSRRAELMSQVMPAEAVDDSAEH